MKLQDVALVLGRLGIAPQFLRTTRPNQLLIPCPLAKWTHKKGTDRKPSCSIRFDDPQRSTLFHCFSCHEAGKLWDLVHTVGEFSNDPLLVQLGLQLLASDEPSLMTRLEHISQDFDAWVMEVREKRIRVLNESVLENYERAWDVQRARVYLQSRRSAVTPRMSEFWGLRFTPYHNRVVFPVRNRQGELVGAVGRAIFDDTEPKYYNMFGFETGLTLGGLHAVEGHPRVAVVEGFHDLMNVWWWNQQRRMDTVCTFTAKTSDEQAAMLQRLDASIVYMYDMDEPGEEGWKEAQRRLEPVTVGLKRVRWKNPDIDVGAMFKVEYDYVLRDFV